MRMFGQQSLRIDLQQMAVMACNRITRDLQLSAPSGVSLYNRAQADPSQNPVTLALVPIEGLDANGRRIWKEQVIAYFWDRSEETLFSRAFPPGPPESLNVGQLSSVRPTLLPTEDLLSLAQNPGSTRTIARQVDHFDVLRWPGGRGVRIELGLQKSVSGKDTPERFDYVAMVTLRN